eukprot:gnl/MRDRNA2_/MRDRNA2_85164_c0_seq8.p1 gnl/MRDRNA2_/MRDRNA2_85164_c0~~gnl/MRDRNA2_/MRDRNA2_85164_c0_seq8.p1  ORF type:complete len:138 (+),score=14.70 gnl/MRDRNA2_/MRDRNA2_85164_c0_seq8:416-829(+)
MFAIPREAHAHAKFVQFYGTAFTACIALAPVLIDNTILPRKLEAPSLQTIFATSCAQQCQLLKMTSCTTICKALSHGTSEIPRCYFAFPRSCGPNPRVLAITCESNQLAELPLRKHEVPEFRITFEMSYGTGRSSNA